MTSDPRGRAFEALEEFEDRCNALDDKPPAQRLQEEAQAFEELAQTLGECFADGLNMPVGQFASSVADLSASLTKTEAKQQITAATQDAKREEEDRQRLDKWILENLNEVRVVRTTDHVNRMRYAWEFENTTLETESGSENGRRHFNWLQFRDSIHEAGGPYLADPPEHLRDGREWREWIVTKVIEPYKVEKTTTGPRTRAVRGLQNMVRSRDAYGSLAEAVDFQGVYVELADDRPDDAEPVDTDESPQELPAWRVGTIYIPNGLAIDVADEHGTSTPALQNEIDARGYMLPGQSKIATREYVNDESTGFWVLTGDFATPRVYHPEGTAESRTGAAALEVDDDGPTGDDLGGVGGGDGDE